MKEFNIAVLVVNQVMADPGANLMFGSAMKPAGTDKVNDLCDADGTYFCRCITLQVVM